MIDSVGAFLMVYHAAQLAKRFYLNILIFKKAMFQILFQWVEQETESTFLRNLSSYSVIKINGYLT